MTETLSDPLERAVGRFGRPARRFVLATVAVVTVAAVGALIVLPAMTMIAVGTVLLVVLWLCPELLYAALALLVEMFRQEFLIGKPASWTRLTTGGRVGRVLVTLCGTALLMAPFVGIGWLTLR
jgi:hypothetical protein